jgi:hypothetical protein
MSYPTLIKPIHSHCLNLLTFASWSYQIARTTELQELRRSSAAKASEQETALSAALDDAQKKQDRVRVLQVCPIYICIYLSHVCDCLSMQRVCIVCRHV